MWWFSTGCTFGLFLSDYRAFPVLWYHQPPLLLSSIKNNVQAELIKKSLKNSAPFFWGSWRESVCTGNIEVGSFNGHLEVRKRGLSCESGSQGTNAGFNNRAETLWYLFVNHYSRLKLGDNPQSTVEEIQRCGQKVARKRKRTWTRSSLMRADKRRY